MNRDDISDEEVSRETCDLVSHLGERIDTSSPEEAAPLAALRRFEQKHVDEKRLHLPSLYLVLEQYLARINGQEALDIRAIRGEIRDRFPRLMAVGDFALIFKSRPRQDVLLGRLFLVGILEGVGGRVTSWPAVSILRDTSVI